MCIRDSSRFVHKSTFWRLKICGRMSCTSIDADFRKGFDFKCKKRFIYCVVRIRGRHDEHLLSSLLLRVVAMGVPRGRQRGHLFPSGQIFLKKSQFLKKLVFLGEKCDFTSPDFFFLFYPPLKSVPSTPLVVAAEELDAKS